MRDPWLAALRERVEECYAAPMLSRAEALALLEIAAAAQNLLANEANGSMEWHDALDELHRALRAAYSQSPPDK